MKSDQKRDPNFRETQLLHKLLLLLLLFFYLLPLLSILFLDAGSAMLSYAAGTLKGSLLLNTAQLLAVLSDISSPVLFAVGTTILSYGLYRGESRKTALAAGAAIPAPLFLSVVSISVTWCLVVLRKMDETPTGFSENLPFYLYSALSTALLQMLFLLAVFLVGLYRGKKFRKKQGVYASDRALLQGNSGFGKWMTVFYGLLSLGQGERQGYAIYNAVAGSNDQMGLLEVVENYGFLSKESFLLLLSGVILPVLYTGITVAGIFLCGRYASEKLEQWYLSGKDPKAGKL